VAPSEYDLCADRQHVVVVVYCNNLLAITEKLVIESTRQWAKAVILWGLALAALN